MPHAAVVPPGFRVLVAIASHGEKNLAYLRDIIGRYRAMPFEIDIVVTSEARKSVDPGVEVVVGLPSRDPWSLPFAHKKIFADRAEKYDLFVYSEDDIGVSEGNLRAFLETSPLLQPDEIAGFMRFELAADKTPYMPDVHLGYHWKPGSVRRRGEHVVAEFSNDHAGLYVLSREQLKGAIRSGGYMQEPYTGKYWLPEAAATDPYTSCGFTKVVCVSRFDDFLVHHLSNRYAGTVGLPLPAFRRQIETLLAIEKGTVAASNLFDVESQLCYGRWGKDYYEKPPGGLLDLFPGTAGTILSVGSGIGLVESALLERGARVTALPLDSVIGTAAERPGLEIIHGTFDSCLERLSGRRFQFLILTNLLHLLPDPWRVLHQCSQLLEPGGTLILGGPNQRGFPALARRLFRKGDNWKLRSYKESGMHVLGVSTIRAHLRGEGLEPGATLRFRKASGPGSVKFPRLWEWFSTDTWLMTAQKRP
jgi:SAM-dependent methyltransferase